MSFVLWYLRSAKQWRNVWKWIFLYLLFPVNLDSRFMRLLKLTLREFLPLFGNILALLVLGCLLSMFSRLSLAVMNRALPFFEARM